MWAGVLDLPGGEQAARRLMAFGLAASAPAALGRRRRLVSAARIAAAAAAGEVEVSDSRRLGWAWVLGRLREGWR